MSFATARREHLGVGAYGGRSCGCGDVAALVARRADVNAEDPETGMTPLLLVAARGDAPVARALLVAQADVHAVDEEGSSCLHWVAFCEDGAACARVLLSFEADVGKTNRDGEARGETRNRPASTVRLFGKPPREPREHLRRVLHEGSPWSLPAAAEAGGGSHRGPRGCR